MWDKHPMLHSIQLIFCRQFSHILVFCNVLLLSYCFCLDTYFAGKGVLFCVGFLVFYFASVSSDGFSPWHCWQGNHSFPSCCKRPGVCLLVALPAGLPQLPSSEPCCSKSPFTSGQKSLPWVSPGLPVVCISCPHSVVTDVSS